MLRSRFGTVVRSALAVGVVLALAGCSTPTPTTTPTAAAGTSSTSAAESSGTPSSASAAPGTATPSAGASGTGSPAAVGGSAFDRTRYSLSDPRSIWVVVDKKRPLKPKSWIPQDLVTPAVPHTNVPQLRRPASTALVQMFSAAKADGITLVSLSAYRSYATQQSIFDRNLTSLGRATTLQLTAKPGYSEHQTGLADDLGDGTSCDLAVCFESHPAAKWLYANSWRYGFIQRYPLGYTKITGIQVEPWHFRFIGVALATEMHRTDVKTLEQFFDLPASPDY